MKILIPKNSRSNLEDKFNQFDSKSLNYYKDASTKMNSLKDSLLKERILRLIVRSEKNYNYKISGLKNLMSEAYKEEGNVEDYYGVLKIMTTIPFIEKYQNSEIPAKAEYKELITKQKLMSKTLDSLSLTKGKF